MKISTNWLKDFVTITPPLEALADRLTMAGLEVKRIEIKPEIKDTVFEVEVTTNRSDWLSHLGVAREIRAVENTGLKVPLVQNPEHRPMPPGWRLDLKEAEGCPYYSACIIEGVEHHETPDWIKNRLLACGLRSVSLIVNITNYILLEMGQPLHAFDADMLCGKEIQIRRAKPGETFTAINGIHYQLQTDDLVIADKERAVALAGVMGGRETEVNERTRNIVLESAFFTPRWVRKTTLRHGISSESSYRFERRVDPEGVDFGRERAIKLFAELTGARLISSVLKAGRKPTLEKTRIHLNLDQVKKVLGVDFKAHQVHSVFNRLGFETKNEGQETWIVAIPSYRPDLERPVDLIEEVARIIGYDKIAETLPRRAPVEIPAHPLRALEEKTRDFFAGAGLFEAITYSLVNPKQFELADYESKEFVEIHNPIHQELTLLRPSFLVSFLDVLCRNERLGERSVSLFEVANLYKKPKGGLPEEFKYLGIMLAGEQNRGWEDVKRGFNFFDLKGILETYFDFLGIQNYAFEPQEISFLLPAALIKVEGEVAGVIGELTPSLCKKWDLRDKAFFAEVSLDQLKPYAERRKKFKEIPKYPSIERDLSLVVDEEVTSREIIVQIEGLGKGTIRAVKLFDLFRGGRVPRGKKNLAFRITYQSPDRTLLSEEIQILHNEIAAKISRKFQASFQEQKS